ncbi:MAG: prepilin-type N-terminal cleavage/methylation domain-containing protein [SAR324 cluster bacterium]|nr:prepilin-type N-terminal cleavage/methylation domain-containing protein [SAR324 cluster bacterium]
MYKFKGSSKTFPGFTLLEVLIALSILTVALIAIYQAFSSSVFILSSTKNLWKAMTHSHNELTRWERSVSAPVSIAQGEFEEDHELAGLNWIREISDVSPFPGILVRKVSYQVLWTEAGKDYSYDAQIYIKPN